MQQHLHLNRLCIINLRTENSMEQDNTILKNLIKERSMSKILRLRIRTQGTQLFFFFDKLSRNTEMLQNLVGMHEK